MRPNWRSWPGTPGARTPAGAATPGSPPSTPPPSSARARRPSFGGTAGRCTSSTPPPAATCRSAGTQAAPTTCRPARRGPGPPPQPPRLDGLPESRVAPGVGERERRVRLLRQRHPGPEHPLVVLHQQVAAVPDAGRRHHGLDLRDVGVDGLLPSGYGDRHPVVAVLDEVQVADPVYVDRRGGVGR